MQVTLTPQEMQWAAFVGRRRHVESVEGGYRPAHGFDGPGLETNVQGCYPELAAAKALGIYWEGVNTLAESDIGHGIQVRSTTRAGYNLIVRPKDPDHHLYLLVEGVAPTFTLVGWIAGALAKQAIYWKSLCNGRPDCYLVSRESLRPIEQLIKMVPYLMCPDLLLDEPLEGEVAYETP